MFSLSPASVMLRDAPAGLEEGETVRVRRTSHSWARLDSTVTVFVSA